MKQSAGVRSFKNELRNYSFYLSRVEALQSLIDMCYEHLPGYVHGVDPSRIPSMSVPNKDLEYRLRNEIEHHERNKSLTEAKIHYCDEILDLMENELRTAIKRIYIDGEHMSSIAMKMYLSTNALQNRINREIERVLNEQEKI